MNTKLLSLCAIGAAGVLFVLLLSPSVIVQAAPWTPTPSHNGGGSSSRCVIPKAGPWPPCATSGQTQSGTTNQWSQPSTSANCTIPKSGPWPACATSGRTASTAPSAPSQPEAQPTAVVEPTTAWLPTPVFVAPTRLKRVTHQVSQLAELEEDARVVVKGRIVSAESFSRGYTFRLNDGTGTVEVLLWLSVYDKLTYKATLNIGAEAVVQGVIDKFQGRVQVVPLFDEAIQVTTPAGISGRQVEMRDLGGYVDQRVVVTGQVKSVSSNQYGTEIVINDGTGDAELFLWSNTYVRLPHKWLLKEGAQIRAAGKVEVYRGQYTITPSLPYDVEVTR